MQVTVHNVGLLAVYRAITSLFPNPNVIPFEDITYELDPEQVREHIAEAILNMPENELTAFCQFIVDTGDLKSVQEPAPEKE